MTTRIEIDCVSGEVKEIELTPEELQHLEILAAQVTADTAERQTKEAELIATREAAHAKLAALGLTPEEIAAL